MIDKDLYSWFEEINTRQAAAAAKVDRRTVVAWITRGNLKAMRNPGKRGHYRILWGDLYELLHTPAVPKQ